MNKKTFFSLILFVMLFSTSYGKIKNVNFFDGSINVSLDYKIESYPKEEIFIFYIPNAIQYYYWKRFDKKQFDDKALKLVLSSYKKNSNQDINILVRTDFLLMKNRIIYSKKISRNNIKYNEFANQRRNYEKIQIF